jgi:AhpD family alkylhydroperoxidase
MALEFRRFAALDAEARALKPNKETPMMLDWEAYRQEVLAGVGEIAHLSPDTVRGYAALGAAGQKADLLGAKVRELIALAVAVTVRCDGCIAVHVNAAIRHGATREEIAEALGVATAINAGAALVFSTRVMDAYTANEKTTSNGFLCNRPVAFLLT